MGSEPLPHAVTRSRWVQDSRKKSFHFRGLSKCQDRSILDVRTVQPAFMSGSHLRGEVKSGRGIKCIGTDIWRPMAIQIPNRRIARYL
jgi:hypothetical protein